MIVDDLDDHLARRDRADDVGADCLGTDRIDEITDDRQRHVGLEQGGADLAQGRVDIGLGERTTPPQLVEYVAQTFTEAFEHPSFNSARKLAKKPVRPNENRADARTFADQRNSPSQATKAGEPVEIGTTD